MAEALSHEVAMFGATANLADWDVGCLLVIVDKVLKLHRSLPLHEGTRYCPECTTLVYGAPDPVGGDYVEAPCTTRELITRALTEAGNARPAWSRPPDWRPK